MSIFDAFKHIPSEITHKKINGVDGYFGDDIPAESPNGDSISQRLATARREGAMAEATWAYNNLIRNDVTGQPKWSQEKRLEELKAQKEVAE